MHGTMLCHQNRKNKFREGSSELKKTLTPERMDFLKNLQELLRQQLTELKNLHEAGKDRNYAPIKVIEDKICTALSVPKECCFPARHSLKDLIENMCGLLDTLQSLPLSPKEISDEDLLKNASGGLALEGILKTRNLEDLLAKREQLIECPDRFSIADPRQSAMYEQKEFSSQKSQSVYQESIEKLGLSFTSSLKAGSQGIRSGTTEEEIKLTKAEEKSIHSYEETCIFNTKYNYIPLASSFIGKDQLRLSSGAIHELKDIEAAMIYEDRKTITSRIARFYDRFGSHVNQGLIHFGGIFWWRASATVPSSDLSDIKKLTSEVLNDFVGAGYNGFSQQLSPRATQSSSQLKRSSSGRSKEALMMSRVQLSISKTGGPAEVDNHLQWKSHLVTSNRTWSVIDRGTSLIPVWQILIAAHKDDIKDAFSLSKILMEAFTDITEVNVENVFEEDLFEVNRAKNLIRTANQWSTSECEFHLKELQKLKSRLLEKTGSHNIWIETCLPNQALQNYLLQVTTVNNYSPAVTTLLRSLLESHVLSVETFPNIKKIMAWITQTQEGEVVGMGMDDRSTKPQETVVQQYNSLLKQDPSLSQIKAKNGENTPENDTVCKKRESFMNLLEKLGLRESYPKMMTQENVLLIGPLSLNVNQPSLEKELSSHYLYKLMMLDYRARNMFIKHDTPSIELEDNGTNVDNDFFNFGDETILNVSCKQAQIHPMDVHMAVFHCANDFLRQFIFKKLSTCQFAIPFLVPDPCADEVEFPFWVLRHISKSWKSKTKSPADRPGKYKSRKMSGTPVPVVSFIRLGVSDKNSKSQILNGVITKQRHSVFFHRHCQGSTPDSVLMNGVVEIAWYCPGGKEDDIFDDCVAFMNLHGDAAEYPKQLEFLQAVSTVNVLLLSEHPMSEAGKEISQKLSQSHVPFICLFSGKTHIQQSKNPTKVRLAAKNRNHAELTEELISNIKRCIDENKQTTSIDMCRQVAVQLQFKVNEVEKAHQEGYDQARTIISLLKEENPCTLKAKFLPLQGQLWHEWCKKNKEQFRLLCGEKESIEQQLGVIKNRMEDIRHRQGDESTPLNDFVRSFLNCLNPSRESKDTKLYMMQWLSVFLEDLTTDLLAELEEDYYSTWKKMREVPKDKEKASHVNQMQSKLNSISDQMSATTISLQHLMREVGQLYEASQTTAKQRIPSKQFARTLPEIGANMLANGCPLELIDGDSAHVPLIWIEAVMDELVKILGNKKLFVLSILGRLQSSGKSTLLNAMFGVQFSVSVGRCTRGAFMQLIPVDSSIKNQLGYDFVLIVDTEGLRSPELSTKLSVSHDNELATFIIGIGDITVINIMGENPSEIHDILQICVQAFLRMKQVNIAPSCFFVHQNVADASAGEKALEGRRRLLQKLDEMATIAARDENIDGINGFSDVIQFDPETQVYYFKSLLEGDPPMAPPNPSYSQDVQKLKTKLLTIAEWRTECKFSSFSEFRSRVGDLWKALLQENFVFSFRNTVEMMVFNSLEEKYGAWSWKLREHALEIRSKLSNQIGSNLIREVNVADLTENFDKVYKPLQDEIEKYFKEDKYKETLIMWRVNIDKRFMNLRTELIHGITKKCDELMTSKTNRSALDEKKTEYTAELTKRSKALASSIKSQRLGDMQVTEEFDKLWKNWTAEVAKAHTPNKPENVKAVVEAILQKYFEKQANILQKIRGKMEQFKFDKRKHVQSSFLGKSFFFGGNRCNFNDSADKIQKIVNHTVNKYVTAKEENMEDFNENFIHEILKNIESTIADFQKTTGNVKFTSEFNTDFSIYICLKLVPRFLRMQDTFVNSNHPLTYLQSQREKYLQAFKNYCTGANCTTMFVDFLCEHIKSDVLTKVNDKTSQAIAREMKANNSAFNSNRSNLENHILKHLATEEDFSSFVEYIQFPKRYFERFIQEKVDKFCSDTGKLDKLHHENLKDLKHDILAKSLQVTEEVEGKGGNTSMWLDCFCKTVGESIVINRNELHTIEKEEIADWQFFKDVIAKSLEEKLKEGKIDTATLRRKPTEYLFQQLQGCWAQCPFCLAICTNTIPDHDTEHSVQFHRCGALGGGKYYQTDIFSLIFCTTAVSSDGEFHVNETGEDIPFKTYRKAGHPFNTWNITPDGSVQRYWKWLICRFQTQWEKTYGYRFESYGQIPDEWKKFTRESVLEELG